MTMVKIAKDKDEEKVSAKKWVPKMGGVGLGGRKNGGETK